MRPAAALLGALAFLAAAAPVRAEEVKLGAAEIESLLTGNTARGEDRGRPTRQYFSEDGITLYQPKGVSPERGQWKVDDGAGRYCSWWPRGGWSCYDVLRDGETYYWFRKGTSTGSDYRSPFTMVPGRQMTF
jgi:hypothetical protein